MTNPSYPDNWNIVDNCANPGVTAGQQLQERLTSDVPQLLLSAGGSALQVFNSDLDWGETGKLSTTVLDERLTNESTARNYDRLQETEFISHCDGLQWCSIMNPWPPEPESPEDTARYWEHKLRGWFRGHEDVRVTALVGVGQDGHIAGIFPNQKHDFTGQYDTQQWVVGYQVDDQDREFPTRMTVTPHFIRNQMDQTVVYAIGARKRDVLRKLVSEKTPPHKQPAQLLKNIPTTVVTDQSLDM